MIKHIPCTEKQILRFIEQGKLKEGKKIEGKFFPYVTMIVKNKPIRLPFTHISYDKHYSELEKEIYRKEHYQYLDVASYLHRQ